MIDRKDEDAIDRVQDLARSALIGAGGDTVEALTFLVTAIDVVATTRHTRADAAELLRAVADSLNNTARLIETEAARPTSEPS